MSKYLVSDSYLVAQYLNGDESALLKLINRHQRKVFGFINKSIKNLGDVDDVFQETFFKVIIALKKGEYKEKEKFLQWVLSITYNTIIEYFRVQKKFRTTNSTTIGEDGEEIDIYTKVIIPIDAHEHCVVNYQQRKHLRSLIRHLKREQRQVIILRNVFGMSFSEIAGFVGTNKNTALGRMHLGLRNLNRLMKQQELNIENKLALNSSDWEENKIYFDYHTIKS